MAAAHKMLEAYQLSTRLELENYLDGVNADLVALSTNGIARGALRGLIPSHRQWLENFTALKNYDGFSLWDKDDRLLYAGAGAGAGVGAGDLAEAPFGGGQRPPEKLVTFFDPLEAGRASYEILGVVSIAFPAAEEGEEKGGTLSLHLSREKVLSILAKLALLDAPGAASYIVGKDNMMRASYTGEAYRQERYREAAERGPASLALAGETGIFQITGQKGAIVLAAYTPLDFNGVRWALVTELPLYAVQAPWAMLWKISFAAILALLCFTALWAFRDDAPEEAERAAGQPAGRTGREDRRSRDGADSRQLMTVAARAGKKVTERVRILALNTAIEAARTETDHEKLAELVQTARTLAHEAAKASADLEDAVKSFRRNKI